MSEEHELTFQEIEQLSWYDLNAHLGIPYFHQGGLKATDRLADLCGIGPETRVLIVGCGTGYSACYLARTRACQIDGFDIAENMVAKAKDRAIAEDISSRVTFQVANAHHLPFESSRYDVILTEFVSMFLDRNLAYPEFMRVLRPGGRLGINELFKEDNIPEALREKIEEAEDLYGEMAGLPCTALTVSAWEEELQKAGLVDVQSEKVDHMESMRERAESVGGWRKLMGLIGRGFLYMFRSKEIRHKMMIQSRFRRIIRQNRSTKQFIGALLVVGSKIDSDV